MHLNCFCINGFQFQLIQKIKRNPRLILEFLELILPLSWNGQMHEIKALKQLIKELNHEKECLLQKVQMDATIISSLSHNALANEDEISKLRASNESLKMQSREPFLASNCEKQFKDFDKREPQREFMDGWTLHLANKVFWIRNVFFFRLLY